MTLKLEGQRIDHFADSPFDGSTSMTPLRRTPLLFPLLLIGCSADIDREQLIKDYAGKSEQFARIHKRCPDLKASIFEIPKMMTLRKSYGVRVVGILSTEYSLVLTAELESKEDGKIGVGSSRMISIQNNSGAVAALNWKELDGLLEADDIDAALAETGVAFELPKRDENQLLALLRHEIPRAEQLCDKFPEARARFWNLKPYRRDGEIIFWASLGTEFEIRAEWEFRTDSHGTTVEWISQGRFELSEARLRIDSAVPHSTSLTRVECDSLLGSATPESDASVIWNHRARSDAPFDNETDARESEPKTAGFAE